MALSTREQIKATGSMIERQVREQQARQSMLIKTTGDSTTVGLLEKGEIMDSSS